MAFAHGILDQKICNLCKIEKTKECFYIVKNNNATPTLASVCKKCSSIRCLIYARSKKGKLSRSKSDKKWKSSERGKENQHTKYLIDKEKRRTPEGREKRRLEAKKYRIGSGKLIAQAAVKRWVEKNKEKRRAQKIANNFHKDKKPCSVCGKFPAHKHHPDYSKPKEIIFLCPLHHKHVHKGELHL